MTATAIGLIALLAIGTAGVSAHSGYNRSTPGDEEVVATAPAQVDVFFGEDVARGNGLPTLIVVDDAGDKVDTGGVLDDNDRKHMSASLNPGLADGRYTVLWHNVSADDGADAQGAFHFYIGAKTAPSSAALGSPGASATAKATVTAAPTTAPTSGDSSGVSVVVLIIGIIAAAVVGGGAGYFAGKRGSS